jgi:hypothetical protein
MKRFLPLALAAGLMLAGCGGAPVTVASVSAYTVGSADAAYIAASQVGAGAVALGKLDPLVYRALDMTAYQALLALRSLRSTATSADLVTANTNLTAALNDIRAAAAAASAPSPTK